MSTAQSVYSTSFAGFAGAVPVLERSEPQLEIRGADQASSGIANMSVAVGNVTMEGDAQAFAAAEWVASARSCVGVVVLMATGSSDGPASPGDGLVFRGWEDSTPPGTYYYMGTSRNGCSAGNLLQGGFEGAVVFGQDPMQSAGERF